MKYLNRLLIIVSILFVIGCSEVETPILHLAPLQPPSALTLKEGYYSITLKWRNATDNRVSSIKIYRGTSKENIKLYASVPNITDTTYIDLHAGIRRHMFYTISYDFSDGSPSKFSDTLAAKPKEPENFDEPNKGEVGGIHYAWWGFASRTFKSLTHIFTIHDAPSNSDGLFYQFYQGYINDDIGFYYGIQTHVSKPGGAKKGLIFSRWGTGDKSKLALAEEGFGYTADSDGPNMPGDFISARANYEWGEGTYQTTLNMDSTTVKGDWYSLVIKKLPNGEDVYMGSIAFEKGGISSGIKSGGGTWTELYSSRWGEIPSWHISIDKVLANGKESALTVRTHYNNNGVVSGFSNTYTTGVGDVHFIMGPKVVRYHKDLLPYGKQ